MRSEIVAMEQLLYIATARGRLDWADWKEACSSVGAGSPLGLTPAGFLRCLEMLGHLEVGFRGEAVQVCAAPAVLSRLPSAGPPSAVLCGGRSPQTEERLRTAAEACGARMSIEPPARNRLPSPRVILVSADDSAALQSAADQARVAYSPVPAAWLLAHAAGSVQTYLGQLDWAHGDEPAIEAREFQPASGRFGRPAPASSLTRLLHYKPKVFAPYHELRCGDRFAKSDRDWAAWACIQDAGFRHVVHDSDSRIFAVPAFIAMPRPLARVLALCTGLTPLRIPSDAAWRVSAQDGHLAFTNIPANIAALVLAKLGQKAVNAAISASPPP